MKRLLLVLFAVVVTACGGGSETVAETIALSPKKTVTPVTPGAPVSARMPEARFVAKERFLVKADVKENTLETAPVEYLNFYSSFESALAKSYVISTPADLEAFNKTLSSTEKKVSLNDLDRYTYFLLRAPGCPAFYELAGGAYEHGELVISVNHFTITDAACAAVLVESYYVVRAYK